MHATKIAFILSSLAGLAVVHAAPTEATAIDPVAMFQPDDGMIFLYSEVVKGETLYWFGDDGSNSDAAAVAQRDEHLQRRCGSNRPLNCYPVNVPNAAACSTLLNQVHDNNNLAPTSPRAVCSGTGNGRCCISWTPAVQNLRLQMLYSPAVELYNSCMAHGRAGSGKANDVSLNGACVALCMSNQATSC